MPDSKQKQIKDLKAIIEKAEMCKKHANTRQQEDLDQRRIDLLNAQLKELES